MIIYSSVPIEMIFDGYDQMKLKYREIDIGETKMIVEQISDSEGRIVRLISPNPQDYLNPRYQPGTLLQFKPDY